MFLAMLFLKTNCSSSHKITNVICDHKPSPYVSMDFLTLSSQSRLFVLQSPLKRWCPCKPWVLRKIYLPMMLIVKLAKEAKSPCTTLLPLGVDGGWTPGIRGLALIAAAGVEFLYHSASVMWFAIVIESLASSF